MAAEDINYKPFPMFALAHTIHHVYTSIMPPLLPVFKLLYNLTYFQAGLLSTVLSGGMIMQLATGFWSDRMGKRVLFVFLGLVSTAVLVGAIGLTDNYLELLAIALFIGVAASAYHPAGTTLVTEHYPKGSRGKALGMHSIGDSLGPGLSPMLIGALTAMLGWQSAVYLLAIPGAIIGFIYWRTVRDMQKKSQSNTNQSFGTEEIGASLRPVAINFTVILLTMYFTMLVSMGMMVFFPLYLVATFKVSQPFASLLLGFLLISGMPGGFVGGWASDKFGRKPVSLLSLAAGPLLVVCLLNVNIGVTMLLLLVLTGFLGFFLPPTLDAFLADITPPVHRGKVYAVYFTATGVWASVVPLIIGGMADTIGLGNALTMAALIALFGIGFGLLMKEKR